MDYPNQGLTAYPLLRLSVESAEHKGLLSSKETERMSMHWLNGLKLSQEVLRLPPKQYQQEINRYREFSDYYSGLALKTPGFQTAQTQAARGNQHFLYSLAYSCLGSLSYERRLQVAELEPPKRLAFLVGYLKLMKNRRKSSIIQDQS